MNHREAFLEVSLAGTSKPAPLLVRIGGIVSITPMPNGTRINLGGGMVVYATEEYETVRAMLSGEGRTI